MNHEYCTQTSFKMFDKTGCNVAGIRVTSVFVAGPFASIIWDIITSIFDLSLYVSSPIPPTFQDITSLFGSCRCSVPYPKERIKSVTDLACSE